MCPRSRLEVALERTGTSVTVFLEQLVGEPLDARQLRHAMIRAGAANSLAVGEGHPLLRRSAVLSGRSSDRPYLYAESLLVPERLPADVLRQLEATSNPIGRILAKERIGFTRSALPWSDPRRASVSGDPPVPDQHLLARTYRIDIEDAPAILIWEWFLPGLAPFLPAGH